jgi:hypothetical protein
MKVSIFQLSPDDQELQQLVSSPTQDSPVEQGATSLGHSGDMSNGSISVQDDSSGAGAGAGAGAGPGAGADADAGGGKSSGGSGSSCSGGAEGRGFSAEYETDPVTEKVDMNSDIADFSYMRCLIVMHLLCI